MLTTAPDRYLLVWLSGSEPIDPTTIVPIRRRIEDTVKEPRDEVEIDVWLESPGGDAHAAFKLALMLRQAASHVRIVVPDIAKSAATLLALAGHEIFLGPGAELGPLDAQLREEGSFSGFISALSIARAYDEVARDAVTLAGRGGAELLIQTGLTRAQTLEAMLRFSASFSEPLVRQLDPKSVHHAKQMLRVTKQYAEWLLGETVLGSRAAQIASRLVEGFPTHGFVICLEEADRLGLPVKPLAEYDLREQVRATHRMAEDGDELIWFGTVHELFSDEEEGDEEGEASGEANNASDQHVGRNPPQPEVNADDA